MNDDEFEHKLRALASRLERPDPTPGWKADILAHARGVRSQDSARPHIPRRLLAAFGTAWLLIAFFRFTTPAVNEPASRATRGPTIVATQGHADTPSSVLIALRSNPEFLDLP